MPAHRIVCVRARPLRVNTEYCSTCSAPQVEEDGGAEDDGRKQAALRAREPGQHVRDHLVQHRRRRQQQARVARHLRAGRARTRARAARGGALGAL